MRGGILAAGIVLLILGIILFFIGYSVMEEFSSVEEFDVYGVPIGKSVKYLDEGYMQSYQNAKSMELFGAIFGIVGFILCIAGIAAPSKHIDIKPPISHQPPIIVQQTQPRETAHSSRHCPECGRSIPFDAKRCPYCDKDFEHHKSPQGEKKEAMEIKEEKKTIEKKEFLQFCHECGKRLDEDVDFCPHCGNKLSKLEE